jgi:hypothetical protein
LRRARVCCLNLKGDWKGNDVELLLSYGIIRGMMKLAVIADGSGICGAPTIPS